MASFNPRAPHGARLSPRHIHILWEEFQSTRPARGATSEIRHIADRISRFQSTRPARGATSYRPGIPAHARVSIHAPRTGRDGKGLKELPELLSFQSTRPARGATLLDMLCGLRRWVSIHAPRTGRDHAETHPTSHMQCFNPRAPHGARLL